MSVVALSAFTCCPGDRNLAGPLRAARTESTPQPHSMGTVYNINCCGGQWRFTVVSLPGRGGDIATMGCRVLEGVAQVSGNDRAGRFLSSSDQIAVEIELRALPASSS